MLASAAIVLFMMQFQPVDQVTTQPDAPGSPRPETGATQGVTAPCDRMPDLQQDQQMMPDTTGLPDQTSFRIDEFPADPAARDDFWLGSDAAVRGGRHSRLDVS